jgi:hypothetical protein
MAAAFAELMHRLGYQRYGAQGGDFGALIGPDLGRVDTESVIGIHVNSASVGFIPLGEVDESVLTEVERARLASMRAFRENGSAYFQIQSTRPHTIAFALNDSPVGQLAWIMEKFKEWTYHPSTELPSLERDLMLTNVMLYWLTGTAGSSAQVYYETMHGDGWPTMSGVPTGVAVFTEDVSIRRFSEATNNIVHWTDFDTGGHFAAMETPDLLVGDVREFFRGLR